MYRLLIVAAIAAAVVIGAISILVFILRVIAIHIRGDAPLRCRNCGGTDVRPSFPSAAFDGLFAAFRCLPFRCRACSYRFYRARPSGAPATIR